MNIDDLTIGQGKELASIFVDHIYSDTTNIGPWRVGEKYLIRTVTMMLTGRLATIGSSELVLEDAAWIADSGRFYDALKTGSLGEVEPFVNDVIVGRGSIIDATAWGHDLPREQK